MIKSKNFVIAIALGLVVVLAGVSLGFSGKSGATLDAVDPEPVSETTDNRAEPAEQPDALVPVPDGEVGVGVFDAESIWHSWQGRQAAEAQHQAIQAEFHKAQESDDQDAMLQAALEMERSRQELMSSFVSAIEAAAEKVAKEANLQIVAGEVFYGNDSVTKREISSQIAAKMNETAADETPGDRVTADDIG